MATGHKQGRNFGNEAIGQITRKAGFLTGLGLRTNEAMEEWHEKIKTNKARPVICH